MLKYRLLLLFLPVHLLKCVQQAKQKRIENNPKEMCEKKQDHTPQRWREKIQYIPVFSVQFAMNENLHCEPSVAHTLISIPPQTSGIYNMKNY